MDNIARIVSIALATTLIICFLALIDVFNLGNGCWYRYDTSNQEQDVITKSVIVSATGQYEPLSKNNTIDASKQYGRWVRSDFYVSQPSGTKKYTNIELTIDGNVSLCHAYLPKNALTCKLQAADLSGNTCDIASVNKFFNGDSNACIETCQDNTDENGNRIRIPRVEEAIQGIPIILRANANGWRNIAKVNTGDGIEVRIGKSSIESNTVVDYIYSALKDDVNSSKISTSQRYNPSTLFFLNRSKAISADCTAGKTSYSMICGRYTPWNNEHYIAGYQVKDDVDCSKCDGTCTRARLKCKPGCSPITKFWELFFDTKDVTPALCTSIVFKDLINPFTPNCGYGTWKGKCTVSEMSDDTLPTPYKLDGSNTVPNITNLSDSAKKELDNDLKSLGDIDCSNSSEVELVKNRKKIYSWRSADYATDLKYRFTGNDNATGHKLGKLCPQNATNHSKDNDGISKEFNDTCYRDAVPYTENNININDTLLLYKLLDANNLLSTAQNNSSGMQQAKYLQYRIIPPELFPLYNTKKYGWEYSLGGYVLYLKQTTCVRKAGIVFSDDRYADRGRISYVIAPSQVDINQLTQDQIDKYQNGKLDVKVEDKIGKAEINAETAGYIWFKIDNHPEDYKESIGQYTIKTIITTTRGSFLVNILNPIVKMIKAKVSYAGKQMFQTMTCYGKSDKSSCINFFLYIRLMLTLYIIVCAFRFMVGDTRMTVTELAIAIIKVLVIAGLVNGSTFRFFSEYLYDFIINASAQLMVNVSGYEYKEEIGVFMFLDQLMTKVFFNKVFLVQVLSVISFGIVGLLYCVMLFVPIILIIISLLKTIMVYLVSMVSIAILIGLAPVFLSFLLFQRTKYLFDNWCSFLIRYILEPVILMTGITVLTQLFVVYLDFVLNYSVCWKCAIYFKIPVEILNSVGIESISQDIPLFCIKWFGAWGYDNTGAQDIGLAMNHVVALMIIAYCIHGYTDFAQSMVVYLTNGAGAGAPSAISIGQSSWNVIYDKWYGVASTITQKGADGIILGINTARDAIKRRGISKDATPDSDDANILDGNRGELAAPPAAQDAPTRGDGIIPGNNNMQVAENRDGNSNVDDATSVDSRQPDISQDGIHRENNIGSTDSINSNERQRHAQPENASTESHSTSSTRDRDLRAVSRDTQQRSTEDSGFEARQGISQQRFNQDEAATSSTTDTDNSDTSAFIEQPQNRDDVRTDAIGPINNDSGTKGNIQDSSIPAAADTNTNIEQHTKRNNRAKYLSQNQEPQKPEFVRRGGVSDPRGRETDGNITEDNLPPKGPKTKR